MTEIKQILSNLRIAGCAVSRKLVLSVGSGVFSSRCPKKWNGEKITLSVKWARNIFKSRNWLKRRSTTAKRRINSALYNVLAFGWKEKKCRESFPARNSSGSQSQFWLNPSRVYMSCKVHFHREKCRNCTYRR